MLFYVMFNRWIVEISYVRLVGKLEQLRPLIQVNYAKHSYGWNVGMGQRREDSLWDGRTGLNNLLH